MMQNRVTENAIKAFGKQPNRFHSSLPDLDPASNTVPLCQTSRDSTHLGGQVHRNHRSSTPGKVDGIFSRSCANIQDSLSFEGPQFLEDECGHMFEWLVEIDLLCPPTTTHCHFVEELLFDLGAFLVDEGSSI